jgi:sulfite exporter TauE/SafE
MTQLLLTVLVASLVGSLHCAGMCGGFVVFYAGGDGSSGLRRGLAHAAYSGGRWVAYAALGAVAGAVGAALDLAGSLAGVQRVAAVAAGAVMVLWGVLALLRHRGVGLFRHRGSSRVSQWVRRGFSKAAGRPPVVKALLVGGLSGLLPCGWLWAFVVAAAGTGSVLAGVAVMTAFWAGTVPVLLAIGVGAQVLAAPLRRHVPAVTAVLLVVLGLLAIVVRPTTVTAAVAERERAAVTRDEPELGHDGLPCCE